MTNFARRIDPSRLTEETVDAHPWFRELLRLWRPAGVPSDNETEGKAASLRLGVRDNYLSFYGAGQSIAKVSYTKSQFRQEVHHKYLKAPKQGQSKYVYVAPPEERAGADLAERVAEAHKWHGREKTFVDEVVGANADVFDLEVALSHRGEGRAVALRLDVAALEPHEGGWRIALWEAKLADDGRVRSIKEPTTMIQHRAYADWLKNDDNAAALIRATRETCRLLLRLRDLAIYAGNTDIAHLGAGIIDVGKDPDAKLTLDRNVRYLINARDDKRGTFIGNGHGKKLRELAGHVQVIGKDDPLILDAL